MSTTTLTEQDKIKIMELACDPSVTANSLIRDDSFEVRYKKVDLILSYNGRPGTEEA